ncbi:hypothetical protein GGR58DRAFT_517203 [Xylaria digitata]|nr:hypothetical protein GGR58DRAFT_517203 [Xylaria digitata]
MATQLTAAELNDTLQPSLTALCTTLVALSALALGLRLWSNDVTLGYRWGWDDVFATLTLVFIVSETALIFWWIDVDLAKGPKIIFIATFFYDFNISLPKFSALFFYHCIFKRTKPCTLLQCRPINAVWEPVPGATCFPQWTPFRRISIVVVFIFGYLVIVVSIGRLVTLAQAGSHLLDDLTWTLVQYLAWVQCEGLVSLISVCLPSVSRLARRVYQDRIKDLSSSTNDEHKGQFIRVGDYLANMVAD